MAWLLDPILRILRFCKSREACKSYSLVRPCPSASAAFGRLLCELDREGTSTFY